MKPTAVRNWHFDHKGKEYDVRAELLSENLHQPHVVVTVHDSSGKLVQLGPGVTSSYSVPMSLQTAPLRQILELDAISEMMRMAEDDVRRRI